MNHLLLTLEEWLYIGYIILLTVCCIPVLIMEIQRVRRNRRWILEDIKMARDELNNEHF